MLGHEFWAKIIVVYETLAGLRSARVSNANDVACFGSSRGQYMMISLLLLFFFLKLVLYMWSKLCATVKISLFILIMIGRLTLHDDFNFIKDVSCECSLTL